MNIRRVCASTRDELLAPQRAHYARVVLDGLAANPISRCRPDTAARWTICSQTAGRPMAASSAPVVALLFLAACSSQDPPRQYSDEELGVDRVVDEWMQDSIPFAQYRTLEEWDEAQDRELPNLLEDSGHATAVSSKSNSSLSWH